MNKLVLEQELSKELYKRGYFTIKGFDDNDPKIALAKMLLWLDKEGYL